MLVNPYPNRTFNSSDGYHYFPLIREGRRRTLERVVETNQRFRVPSCGDGGGQLFIGDKVDIRVIEVGRILAHRHARMPS